MVDVVWLLVLMFWMVLVGDGVLLFVVLLLVLMMVGFVMLFVFFVVLFMFLFVVLLFVFVFLFVSVFVSLLGKVDFMLWSGDFMVGVVLMGFVWVGLCDIELVLVCLWLVLFDVGQCGEFVLVLKVG